MHGKVHIDSFRPRRGRFVNPLLLTKARSGLVGILAGQGGRKSIKRARGPDVATCTSVDVIHRDKYVADSFPEIVSVSIREFD